MGGSAAQLSESIRHLLAELCALRQWPRCRGQRWTQRRRGREAYQGVCCHTRGFLASLHSRHAAACSPQ
jgi:hypothetical protein